MPDLTAPATDNPIRAPRQTADIPSRDDAPAMFNRIAHRYDLLNRLLSGWTDVRWRQQVAKTVIAKQANLALDLATGTADQLLSLYDGGKIAQGIGLDPASAMLAIGREKISKRGLEKLLRLELGSAEQLPFADQSFDLVTMSFGIRNVTDVAASLGELYRVLRPGGQVIILEFSLPANRAVRSLYLLYFRHLLPKIGAILSGDSYAYNYLNKTVETFPHGNAFAKLLVDAGMTDVTIRPLTLGIASIYSGVRR